MILQKSFSPDSNRLSSIHPRSQNISSKSALKSAAIRTPKTWARSYHKKGVFALIFGAVLAFWSPQARADDETEPTFDGETMVAAVKMEPPPEFRPLPEIAPEEAQISREETPSRSFFNFFPSTPKTVRDVRMEVGPKLEEILQIGNEAENARFYALIQDFSQAFSYDPVLIQDLVIRESKGKNQAISPTGAKGLFQTTHGLRQDIRGEAGGRGFKYYGEKLQTISLNLASKIPDRTIQKTLTSYLSEPDNYKKYQEFVRSIASSPHNPYASMLMGLLCLDGFKDMAMKRDPVKLVAEVRAQVRQIAVSPGALQKVNRSRVIDGKPEITLEALKGVIREIGKEEAIIMKTLSGYSGTGKDTTYPLVVGALDSIMKVN